MTQEARFSVLGSLVVSVGDERVEFRAAKHRALLAALLLRPGQRVSVEQLADDLWGPSPPRSSRHLVQVYVSDVRRGLAQAGAEDRVETDGNGYRINVAPGEVDSDRFEQLVAAAEESLRAGDPSSAVDLLGVALALWRGSVLAGTPLEDGAAALCGVLEERRLAATELRIAAELACGAGQSLVSELEQLVAAHPFRELLRAQLMQALYRSGRQAEALAAYQDARRLLVEELGIEPGHGLRDLERAILNQDESLHSPRARSSYREGLVTVGAARRTNRIRRGPTFAAAILACLAVAAVIVFMGRRGGDPVAAAAGSVVAVDPRTGRLVAAVEIGSGVGPIAAMDGRLWIGDRDAHTLSLVDSAARKVVRVIGLPAAPFELAAGGDVVWITYGFDGTIARYDSRTRTLTRPFHPLAGVRGLVSLAVTARDVWLGLADSVALALDPVSSQVKQSVRLQGAIQALAADRRAVWVGTFPGSDLVRIDAATGAVLSTQPMASSLVDVAVDGRSAWALTAERVTHVVVGRRALGLSVPAGPGAEHVAVGGGSVWVSSSGGVLEQINARSGEIRRTIRLRHEIGGIVFLADLLWVTLA